MKKDFSHTYILNTLRRCTVCTRPETHETIEFDNEGVCNICRGHEYKKSQIDWEDRKKQLLEMVQQYRGKGTYDCLVPFSGGKDSTFILWYVVKELGLKPLVVSFDHGFYRPQVLENNEKTQRILGVDFLKLRTNWHVVRKLMLESFKRKGDFDWHAHLGLFTFPMQTAIRYQVPLIFYGEPPSEYTAYYDYERGGEVDNKNNERINNLGIAAEDMAGFLEGQGVSLRDLDPYRAPATKELKTLGVRALFLGSFKPWDAREHYRIIKEELGWQGDHVEGIPFELYPYEKVEYQLQGARDYLKFIKRGYARTTHLTSIDIQNGRMTREEAKRLIETYEGKRPASLDYLLPILGIDEAQWRAIATAQVIPPYRHDFSQEQRGEPLWDMHLWNQQP